MARGIVLSLCDRSGVMVQPWLAAGFDCYCVDIQHPPGVSYRGNCVLVGADVRTFWPNTGGITPGDVAIVFAFPPCTHLANSGNRHKRDKGLEALYEALGLVIACKRICEDSGAPWMLENPIGSLSTYWRPPDYMFQPWQYGTPKERKRTCIWAGNNFVLPPIEVTDEPADVRESCWHMPPSADRADKRSVTPAGFARAVFAANAPWLEVA